MNFIKNLKVTQTLQDRSRISSIDIVRAIAIIGVVFGHYGYGKYGYLGVDLFFIISGFLVGGILITELEFGEKVNFFKFIISRGFKIWPSYYFFLITGGIIARILYSTENPNQIIPLNDLKRYVFFYQNYTNATHWSFDHVWSLCVEEHFYILLPILFIVLQYLFSKDSQKKFLYFSVVGIILSGILFKFASFYFTNSKDIYSGTHNRIDALAWGVLLRLIINDFRISQVIKILSILLGIVMLVGVVIWVSYHDLPKELTKISEAYRFINVYNHIFLHIITPISFFLIIIGIYYVDFSWLYPMRVIAYFSYNWYLWHQLFVTWYTKHLGSGLWALGCYLTTTFLIAVIVTIFVEENFLQYRKKVIKKLFPSTLL